MKENNSDPSLEDSVGVFDLIAPSIRHYKLFVCIVALITLSAFCYALTTTKLYRSSTTIMPTDAPRSTELFTSLMGSLMPSVGGTSTGTTLSTMSILLNSQQLAECVFDKLRTDLLSVMYPDLWDSTHNQWKVGDSQIPKQDTIIQNFQNSIHISQGKDRQTLELSSTQPVPELSKKIADEYLVQLDILLNQKDLTVAQRNKTFIEGQLAKNKKDYFENLKAINMFYAKVPDQNNLMQLDLDKELNLPSLPTQNNASSAKPAIMNFPANFYLEYLSGKQVVMKTVIASLEQQYLSASIEAEKDKLSFFVVDKAKIPTQKFKPKLRQIIVLSGFSSLFVALLVCYVFEFWKKNRESLKKRMASI